MKNNTIVTIADLLEQTECVFCDTARPDAHGRESYLFTGARSHVTAWTPDGVRPALERIQKLSERFWLAGYIRYEAAAAFLPRKMKLSRRRKQPRRPLVWFGVYEKPRSVRGFEGRGGYAPVVTVQATLSYADYARRIKQIKSQIQNGNTYQVNFTFDMMVKAGCSPEVLYAHLRNYQKTPYCAFIKNACEQVLCFSPELFFSREGSRIWTRPMKGTAARGATDPDDVRKRDALRRDEKNRAENLMIVDLLRNDLGRIAQTGSVSVPSLFDVETHPTLHQMTSLIQADLKDGVTYAEIFGALFPCGSVTGAPKLKTMEIIRQTEEGERGVYCGAIGYIAPGNRAVFTVPIRILQRPCPGGPWQYRVGSGIVWDSASRGEWQEAAVKAAFLTSHQEDETALLETLCWQDGRMVFEKEHVARMRQSARDLGFPFSPLACRKSIAALKTTLARKDRLMIRFLLSRQGRFRCDVHPITPPPSRGPARVRVSRHLLDAENLWLRHKTTYRPWYRDALAGIQSGRVWDELFFNQRGELCEGARSNVFLEINGRLYTPPVACGLLPGILRARLLQEGRCIERVLERTDLKRAEKVFCGNSVRGLQQVRVVGS